MHPDKLGPLLVKRLQEGQFDPDVIANFLGATPLTVHYWFTNTHQPRGAAMNALWHFLATVGVDSPEIDQLPSFSKYLGQLLAFSVISLEEAQEICGLKNPQGVFKVTRGQQQPSHPLYTAEELQEAYDSVLQAAMEKLRASTETAEAAQTVVQETRQEEPDVPVPVLGTKIQPAESTQLILQVSSMLGAVHPLVQYVLSDACTDENRAQLRELLGFETVFTLSNALNRLCSTRAFHDGGK